MLRQLTSLILSAALPLAFFLQACGQPGVPPTPVPKSDQNRLTCPDSDGDRLCDAEEDPNGNNVVDPGETDPRKADSNDDGTDDGHERWYQSSWARGLFWSGIIAGSIYGGLKLREKAKANNVNLQNAVGPDDALKIGIDWFKELDLKPGEFLAKMNENQGSLKPSQATCTAAPLKAPDRISDKRLWHAKFSKTLEGKDLFVNGQKVSNVVTIHYFYYQAFLKNCGPRNAETVATYAMYIQQPPENPLKDALPDLESCRSGMFVEWLDKSKNKKAFQFPADSTTGWQTSRTSAPGYSVAAFATSGDQNAFTILEAHAHHLVAGECPPAEAARSDIRFTFTPTSGSSPQPLLSSNLASLSSGSQATNLQPGPPQPLILSVDPSDAANTPAPGTNRQEVIRHAQASQQPQAPGAGETAPQPVKDTARAFVNKVAEFTGTTTQAIVQGVGDAALAGVRALWNYFFPQR